MGLFVPPVAALISVRKSYFIADMTKRLQSMLFFCATYRIIARYRNRISPSYPGVATCSSLDTSGNKRSTVELERCARFGLSDNGRIDDPNGHRRDDVADISRLD